MKDKIARLFNSMERAAQTENPVALKDKFARDNFVIADVFHIMERDYVKNKVMEFAEPDAASMSTDCRDFFRLSGCPLRENFFASKF